MPSFKPKERPEEDQNIWNVTLPLDVLWGIYARQSTQGQVLNHIQSTEMQTDDLIQWLVIRGVSEGHIFLFDADLGVSGTLRIDQRTGLQELVVMIKQGKIKAVLVYQISRLFRDETGVQYNVFANICKQHNCLVVTADGMIFNFRNPMHLKMFRFLAEMAAEYIPQQIGLLHQARERKARKGFYAGLGSVPRGYIVDYNEKSPSFRKLTPYRPHADIVFSLFQRFFELDGDFARLCRELQDLLVIFPPFEDTIDPRNTRNNHFKKVLDGYYLTRGGLVCILTNPVYIGWWIVKGDIISRNNHERIIDEEHEYLFWYAFDRLSEYTVEGKINEKHTGIKRPYYQRRTVNPDGLLKNRIRGVTGKIYTHIHADKSVYCLKDNSIHFQYQLGDMVNVSVVEREFLQLFFKHLRSTHDFDNYRKYLSDMQEQRASTTSTLTLQLVETEKRQKDVLDEMLSIRRDITNQVAEKLQEYPSLDPETLKQELEKEYAPLVRNLRKLSATLETTKEEIQTKLDSMKEFQLPAQIAFYADFHTELEALIASWEETPFTDRRDFVSLFVSQAILDFVAPHWVQLSLDWALPAWESETLLIYRTRGSLFTWTDSERELIKEHYTTSNKETLLKLLPNRSWKSIRNEAVRLGIKERNRDGCPLPMDVTWADWQFLQKQGITDPTFRNTILPSQSRPNPVPPAYLASCCVHRSYALPADRCIPR